MHATLERPEIAEMPSELARPLTAPIAATRVEKKPDTAILMLTDGQWMELLNLSIANKTEYARRHSYDLVVRDYVDVWHRFVEIDSLLDFYQNVLYIDTDTVITNMTRTIDQNIASGTRRGFYICADLYGFNSGVIVARDWPMTRQLLHAINGLGKMLTDGHPWREQEVLRRFLTAPPYVDDPFWVTLPQRQMNAYWHYEGREKFEDPWKPGDWILHLPGMTNEDRLEIIKEQVLDWIVR